MKQLPLAVRLQDRAVFASFLPGPNAEALAAAGALAQGQGRTLYMHGPAGTGRSHLLQAICAAVPGSAYLPLRRLREAGAEVLEGLGGLPLVALDDVDHIAGDDRWERGLFHLHNECQAASARLAIVGAAPATRLGLGLPDLASRLAAMPHYALRPLDEPQQREALRLHAAQRGIEVPQETLIYLQRRFARDMASLHALLEQLDLASLEEQRRLTLPFIRRVLGDAT